MRLTNGDEIEVDNPSKLPSVQEIDKIFEPWVDLSIVAPSRYIGAVMELVTSRRGEYTRMEYLQSKDSTREDASSSAAADARVLLEYKMPLAELLVDFHSQLKSRTQGYASMDYSIGEARPGDMVKLDVLVNYTPVDALSMMLHRDNAQSQGRELVAKLRKLIPRQMFDVPIQSAVGNRVIARETVKAMRKNVLAKCYGGDVSRKRKLLEKQAKGTCRRKRSWRCCRWNGIRQAGASHKKTCFESLSTRVGGGSPAAYFESLSTRVGEPVAGGHAITGL